MVRKLCPYDESYKKVSIAVMTSGGDAPGMNAAIRGVYSRAKEYGYRVIGIRNGFQGLLQENFYELELSDVEDIISKGGTILGTSRCEEFKEPWIQKRAAGICHMHGITAVVVIGGDGSMRGASKLHDHGVGVVCVPGTIDLDVGCTEYTLGFDTAINSAMENIDKIADTSKAHNCYSVVEVMGRSTGYIAMHCGIACSSRRIIVPERECLDSMIQDLKGQNRNYGTIVVAEGAGHAEEIAEKIEKELNVHTRTNILGFLQRGGSPTCKDRVYGCMMGAYAVDLIQKEQLCHVVNIIHGEVTPKKMDVALMEKRTLQEDFYLLGKTICK